MIRDQALALGRFKRTRRAGKPSSDAGSARSGFLGSSPLLPVTPICESRITLSTTDSVDTLLGRNGRKRSWISQADD